jgi:hypothetical protein
MIMMMESHLKMDTDSSGDGPTIAFNLPEAKHAFLQEQTY